MRLSINILFLVLFFTNSSNAGEHENLGGEHSGSADYQRVMRAWFRTYNESDAKIKYCFFKSDKFGVSDEQLKTMIEYAFTKWGNYIVQKDLDRFVAKHYLVSRTTFLPKCDDQQDVTFYFGVENEDIRKLKSHYNKPFGFAETLKQSDDPWNPGLVWIAGPGQVDTDHPDWKRFPGSLQGLILHEVGHIFGNGHVDGTVMTSKIWDYLSRDTGTTSEPENSNLRLYSIIDSTIELVPCLECSAQYWPADHFDEIYHPNGPSDIENTFIQLVGAHPVGTVSLYFERHEKTQGNGQLVLTDQNGSYLFEVVTTGINAEVEDNAPLFGGMDGRTFHSFGISFLAEIKPMVGPTMEVKLNYNMGKKKVVIAPLRGFYPRPLFVTE